MHLSPRTSLKQSSPSPLLYEIDSYTLYRLIEEGGDWDRRNRLKVYRGLREVSIRQFKSGGELLLDALSTFTATELISYNDFVALAIIVNALTLKRVDLKKKVSLLVLHYPGGTQTFYTRLSFPLRLFLCFLTSRSLEISCAACMVVNMPSFLSH